MRGWMVSLAGWRRLPVLSGLNELDKQIMKFRILKEAYVHGNASSIPDGGQVSASMRRE